MIISEYSTDLRLLLPEVIWLELEHYQQAKKISSKIENEAQQWQAYINILGRSALAQWLSESVTDKQINAEPKVTELVSYLKLGEFRIAVVAKEHLLDEVVSIPQTAIERAELAAHFYVIVEVDEEQEQAVLRGFLRYDELSEYRREVDLQTAEDGCYRLPLTLFDAEPNHLLSYSRYLEPSAIALPTVSTVSATESLQESLDSSRTKLSQWLQGALETGWLTFEELVAPEANLAWNTRSVSEQTRKGKLIDLGMQLEDRAVALLITVTPEAAEKVGILVQLYPTGGARHLPADLQVVLYSKTNKPLQSTRSRSQDSYIQLKSFKGKLGTRFGIEVSMGDTSVRENFEL